MTVGPGQRGDGKKVIVGGVIEIDTLTAGTHTIVITAVDGVGNTSTKTLTFTIHATVKCLVNEVNDGVSAQLNSALNGNRRHQKLQTFVYMVQQASGKSITPAYATLLANWGQDLTNRTP